MCQLAQFLRPTAKKFKEEKLIQEVSNGELLAQAL
jgi:hypothetical protein